MESQLPALCPTSTLADVRRYDLCVSPQTPVNGIVADFERDADLPGAVIVARGQLVGMLSRQRCLERLSQRFGVALFRDAAVEKMLDSQDCNCLVFPLEMSVEEAAARSLNRPRALAYEPVVVHEGGGRFSLLSSYDLLLAQSHILSQANATIRRQVEAVQQANRAKSEFVTNMSHEIRTPLNAILGMTQLLMDSEPDQQRHRHLGIVAQSGEMLLEIINDMLDFAKIEAGKIVLDAVAFDLAETVCETMKALAVRASHKGLELAYHCDPRVPPRVLGDPLRLRQVLYNLAGNAIKFTERGEVVVEIMRLSRTDADVLLEFSVRDTGIGIAADKLERIFQAFEQADGSTTRRFGGTGLGLSISSRLVEIMGGRIEVESQPGRGSVFHFNVCLSLPGGAAGADEPRWLTPGTPVLVVQPQATQQRIMAEMLAAWRLAPRSVDSPDAALAELRRAEESGRRFALVISDFELPGCKGLELADAIDGDRQLHGTPFILLAPGHVTVDDAECRRHHCRACLIKPVSASELFNTVSEALVDGPQRRADSPTSAVPPPTAPALEILLAEDNALNQQVAVEMLGRQGHRITVVENGRQAVEMSARRPFDVILMDVQMPEMDGFEATRAIRQREQAAGRHTPIVALTAHATRGDEEHCLQAGMDDYVSKPVRARTLMAKLSSLVGRDAPQRSATAADVAAEATEEASAQAPAVGPAEPAGADIVVDWSAALSVAEGDAELLRFMAEAFLVECPKMLEALRAALAAGDPRASEIASHTLKGAFRYFGPLPVAQKAFELERKAARGDLQDTSVLLTDIEAATGRLLACVQDYVAAPHAAAAP